MSWTVMSSKVRRAAHGRHRCYLCGRNIRARSEYLDTRISGEGTAFTNRAHVECDRLMDSAINYWSLDPDDLGNYEDTVCDYQRDIGLPVTGWPEVPS